MTHELKQLFETAARWQQAGKKTVLATVVNLEGSSYRRPGVRMLLCDSGEDMGAVSGGCVENEIHRQAQSVFRTGKAKIMTYDGRLRLGCDGLLYLLLEPFEASGPLVEKFHSVLKGRHSFSAEAYYYSSPGEYDGIGSILVLDDTRYSLNPAFKPDPKEDTECFSQTFPPLFQLYIFGAEHDAVHLCHAAHLLGWEVTVVAPPEESKSISYFPGASQFLTPVIEHIDASVLDQHTAVVLMSHSYNKDVQYLMALKEAKPAYFGLLGPAHRRERLINEFLERSPDASPEFLEQLHGPAGLNIGAESAPEIAVSVLAEILGVIRNQAPVALREKSGSIHG